MMQHRRSKRSPTISASADEIAEPTTVGARERNRQAAELLQRWSAADDGYDDEIWPLLEQEIKEHRVVIR